MRMSWMVPVAVVLCAAGCGIPRYDVEVMMDESYVGAEGKTPSVEVRLIGVPAEKVEEYARMKVSDVFTSPPSSTTTKALTFAHGEPGPQMMARDDDLWQHWFDRGFTNMFVFANLPGVRTTGGEDPRRLGLSIEKADWRGKKIQIVIENPASGEGVFLLNRSAYKRVPVK